MIMLNSYKLYIEIYRPWNEEALSAGGEVALHEVEVALVTGGLLKEEGMFHNYMTDQIANEILTGIK